MSLAYSNSLRFLLSLRLFGYRPGLETPRRLAALAGNPEQNLRFIHVAGTNGKGSVCAMLESVLRAAGYRVGLYTSPHLVSFCERIQVNRQMIAPDSVARLTDELRSLCGQFSQEEHPTFFEVVTIMALRYFAEQKCDVVIWETGLGGRLDATNIVTPLASVITNVQLDHQQWLGDTTAKIAREKAGIIKPGIPVTTAARDAEVLSVLREYSAELDAPLRVITEAEVSLFARTYPGFSLRGAHQLWNGALALALLETLQSQLRVSAAAIAEGLAKVEWPGRFQVLERNGQTVVLDGAHNAAGMKALGEAWQAAFPGRKPVMILGALADKDTTEMCLFASGFAASVVLVPVRSDRTAAPSDLGRVLRRVAPDVSVSEAASLSAALVQTAKAEQILVAGSLYLVGEALELLGLARAEASGEHSLNERLGISIQTGVDLAGVEKDQCK